MLKLLFYPSQYTKFSDAEKQEMTFDELEDLYREPEIVTTKGSEPQFFPGAMLHDAMSKGDTSVDRVYVYCLDLDGISKEKFLAIVGVIQRNEIRCFAHSTWSHLWQLNEDGTYRVRFIIALSRPVLRDEWRIFWSNCRIFFLNEADKTTASPSKHYLVASVPPGDEAKKVRIFETFAGKPIDVDAMMSRYGTKLLAEAEVNFDVGTQRITGSMFQEFVSRRWRGEDAKVAHALKAALAKNTYAETGARESTLFAIAGLLAKEYPRGNPDDLCEPLRYSVEFEQKKGGPKFSEFRDKVVRRQRDVLQRAAEKQVEATKELAKVAGKKDLIGEYTPASLEPYFKSCGNKFGMKELKDRLVLIHKNNFYVFDGSGYKSAVAMSLPATIRKYLQFRAETHLDFSYFYPVDGGKPPEPKSNDSFVKDHGDVINDVVYTYEGASWYDEKKGILWLSGVDDPNKIVGEFSKEVDQWLTKLTDAPSKLKLEQWMAQFHNTAQALCGLVLTGPSGIGKSAFAMGMATMFGEVDGDNAKNKPCTMANYLSSFNSEVIKNPLVFADEELPKINGKVPTDQLRTIISSETHDINRKGLPIATLKGFVRVIMALQTADKFDFGHGHTREDIDAIEKRYLIIPCSEDAAPYFDYHLFVTHRKLIKHAMYLAQTIPRASDRFGVETTGSDHVIAADPTTMAVADWIYAYMTLKVHSSAKLQQLTQTYVLFVNKGRLFVSALLLSKDWENNRLAGQRKEYTMKVLSEALRSLSVSRKPTRVKMPSGKQETFWEIKHSVIKTRALSTGATTPEQFDLLMQCSYEVAFKTVSFQLTDEDKKLRMQTLKKIQVAK